MKQWKLIPPVTKTSLFVCTAITVLIHVIPFEGNSTETAILFGAYYKTFVSAGEWWRLFTAGFEHVNFWHLLMNMYSLYLLGSVLERTYRPLRYFLLLCLSSIAGYAFLFVTGGNTVAVGLSGGLYGLMAAYFILVYKAGGFRIPQVRNSCLEVLAINLIMNFMPGIGYQVHLGGLFMGALLGILFTRDPQWKSVRSSALLCTIAFSAVLMILIPSHLSIPEDERYLGTDARILTYEKDHGLQNYAEGMARRIDDLYEISYLEETLTEDNG